MNAAVRQKPAHGGLQTGVHRAKVDAPDKAAQRPHQQQKQHGPRGQPGAGLQQALRVLSRGRRRAVTASVQPPSRAILSNRRRSAPLTVAA